MRRSGALTRQVRKPARSLLFVPIVLIGKITAGLPDRSGQAAFGESRRFSEIIPHIPIYWIDNSVQAMHSAKV